MIDDSWMKKYKCFGTFSSKKESILPNFLLHYISSVFLCSLIDSFIIITLFSSDTKCESLTAKIKQSFVGSITDWNTEIIFKKWHFFSCTADISG